MTAQSAKNIDGSACRDRTFLNQPLHHRFMDVDELAAYLREGDVTITPLSLTPFRCDAMALPFKTIRISFNRANTSLRVVGSKEAEFLHFVCLLEEPGQPVISHGYPITPDYLFGFDRDRGVNMVFPQDSIHCCIAVRQDVFETCAQTMERHDLDARFLAPNFVYAPATLSPLLAYLQQIYTLLMIGSPLLKQPNFPHLVLQDLLPLLIGSIPWQGHRLKPPAQELRRAQLIQAAETYLHDHLHEPVTMADLCAVLNVSRRTLFYGFEQLLGMSPTTYLKALRLHAIRRTLKASDPESMTVVGVAYRFGFWSMGHFARDYLALFGERPSETLSSGDF